MSDGGTILLVVLVILVIILILFLIYRAIQSSNQVILIRNVATQGFLMPVRMTINGVTANYVVGTGAMTDVDAQWNLVVDSVTGNVAIFNISLQQYMNFAGLTNNELVTVDAPTVSTAASFTVFRNIGTGGSITFQDSSDTEFVLNVDSAETIVPGEAILTITDIGTSAPNDDQKFVLLNVTV